MRTYLLPATGNDYKANLHCHSTVSDGRLTPEELKKIYQEKGYSIIAYTDHDYLKDQQHLTDGHFLALNGYELYVNDPTTDIGRTCHMCFVARRPDLQQILVYPSQFLPEGTEATFQRSYTPACISSMMQAGRDAGFFVTYNHPSWSQENYLQYSAYRGMHALEIVNFGSLCTGWNDENDHVYDDIIRAGNRIFAIAADDNHNATPPDSRKFGSFGGFTVIRADRLEYTTVTDALFAGHFYASEGPLIHDLYLEDGQIHITCSPCDRIAMTTNRRAAKMVYRDDTAPLTEAVIDLKENTTFFRLTVIDERGYKAFTNAYFLDEIGK